MAPPRRFTREQILQRQRERNRERQRAERTATCSVSRCTSTVAVSSDLCSRHRLRKSRYGSTVAGKLSHLDYKRMLRRVRSIRRRIDTELLSLALKACRDLVLIPGQEPAPPRRSYFDREYRVSIALGRLMFPTPPKQRFGLKPSTPVTADEVFEATMAAWLCALTPGAITRGHRSAPAPKYTTRDAIASLIGRRIVTLRGQPAHYGRTVNGVTRTCARNVSLIAIRTIGARLVEALSPMMILMLAEVRKSIEKTRTRIAANKRKREALISITHTNKDEVPTVPEDCIT